MRNREERRERADETAEPRTDRNERAARQADALPELSEEGGIEPQERDPSKFHDRTRDRNLDER